MRWAAAVLTVLWVFPLLARGQDAAARALAEVERRRAVQGIGAADLTEWREGSRHRTSHNGVTHVYLRQQIGGIDVFGAGIQASVRDDGRVFAAHDGFRRRVASRASSLAASRLTAAEALRRAAAALGLDAPTTLEVVGPAQGAEQLTRIEAPELSLDPIDARLAYQPIGADLRLAWNAALRTPDGRHWWHINVDAVNGELLFYNDWMAHADYRVFPLPLESPNDGGRTLEVDPHDPIASPFGWHDADGVAGAEFTDTRGNNCFAQEDIDADDIGGARPDGGPALSFDFPLSLDLYPWESQDATVTNLFYLNNIAHDVFYRYGFDERSGNFQASNYGRGGLGGDPVIADAQDGSDTDNANFGTPIDGQSGRMQMFLFELDPSLVVSNTPVAGTFPVGIAEFGGLFGSGGVPSQPTLVVAALDPADALGPSTTDACSPLTNAADVAGSIALVDRGDCTFVEKAANAQAAGALAVVIANNAGDELVTMSGTDPSLFIPAAFVGQTLGASIRAQLPGLRAQLVDPARDSALDTGIVIHEYGHGVSNRLTGGPGNVDCLGVFDAESRGMGEGWSDFWALAFTARPTDTAGDARTIASYPSRSSVGIRNFPYSTDLSINPQTYIDIATTNQPHGIGEVWAAALWEVYWRLVELYGFEPDLYAASGGNGMMLQLVMDGLKMQPCQPTFVTGRDALIAADAATFGGAHECLFWEGFAKRGVGSVASDGGSAMNIWVTEDFSVPAACSAPLCSDNVIAGSEQCDGTSPGLCTAGCSAGCTCTPDADADTVGDAADNCPFVANPAQLDSGGFLSAAQDGIGDACQCADVNSSGSVDASDSAWLRNILAGLQALTPTELSVCAGRALTGACDLVETIATRRALQLGAAPQSCPNATAPG